MEAIKGVLIAVALTVTIITLVVVYAAGIEALRVCYERRNAKSIDRAEPQHVEPSEPPEPRSWGARVGNLTQFGETWLDVADIQAVEFGPLDGCGCEVRFRGTGEQWHVPIEDAVCLKAYFTEMDQFRGRMEAVHSRRVD